MASEVAFKKVSDSAEKASKSVAGGFSKIGSVGADIGKGIAVGGVALAASAIGIGVALYKVGEQFDDAYHTIRVGTGATGDVLKGFEDSVKNVFTSVPTSLQKASDAFVALQQRTGGAGKPLEDVTKQLLELSRITKTDLSQNVGSVEDAFQSFGVTLAQQPKMLDELFRAFQATGTSVADISTAVAGAQPQLKALGFSFEQSAALAAILGKAGSSLDDVLPALNKSMAEAAKHGKDAGTVFRETFDAIKNAPNATIAAGDALKVFGARAGPKLAELIREGKLSYQDLLKTMQGGTDTIIGAGKDTQDFAEKLTLFKAKLKVAFEPVALKVFDALGIAMDKVGPVLAKFVTAAVTGLGAIARGFKTGVDAGGIIGVLEHIGAIARTVFTEIAGSVKSFIAAFTGGITDITSSGLPGFFEKVGFAARAVFDWLKEHGPAIFAAVKDAGAKAFSFLGGVITTAFDWLKENGPAIFDAVRGAVEKFGDILENKVFPVVKKVIGFLSDHKEVLVGIAATVGVLLVGALYAWAAATLPVIAANIALAAATALAYAPFIAIAVAIGAAVAGVIYAYKHFKTFHDIVDSVGRFFRDDFLPALVRIGGTIRDTAEAVGQKLGPAFQAIGDFIASDVIPAVKKFADFMGTEVIPVVVKVIEVFARFYIKTTEIFFKILSVVAPVIAKVVELFVKFQLAVTKLEIKVIEVLTKIIAKAVELGIKVGKAIADVVKWFVDFGEKVFGVGARVVEAVAGIVEKFIDVAKTVADKVGEIVGFIIGIGARILSGAGDVFKVVKDAITDAAKWVGEKVDVIVEFVKGIGKRIGEFAEDLFFDVKLAMTVAKNWISDKVDDVIAFFRGLPGTIRDALVTVGDIITKPFIDAFNYIKQTWDSTVGPIFNALGALNKPLVGDGKPIRNFGGGKAIGGDVSSSKFYVVGEKGPELFFPGRSGSIVPTDVLKRSAAAGTAAAQLTARLNIASAPVRITPAAQPRLTHSGSSSNRTMVIDLRGAHISGVTDFKKAVKEAVQAGSKADGGWAITVRKPS